MNLLQLPLEGYACAAILNKAFIVIWSEKAYKKVKSLINLWKSHGMDITAFVVRLPQDKDGFNALMQQMLYENIPCVFVDFPYAFKRALSEPQRIAQLGKFVTEYIMAVLKAADADKVSVSLREKLKNMSSPGIYIAAAAEAGGEMPLDVPLTEALRSLSADLNILKAREAYIIVRCNAQTPGQDDLFEVGEMMKSRLPEAQVAKVRIAQEDYMSSVLVIIKCI